MIQCAWKAVTFALGPEPKLGKGSDARDIFLRLGRLAQGPHVGL